jgi:hypothetical protein
MQSTINLYSLMEIDCPWICHASYKILICYEVSLFGRYTWLNQQFWC